MYKKLNIPPLGIIENMSHFVCRNCGTEADIFGHGGGEAMATRLGLPFVGRIPIYQPIREGSDTGVPLMISEPESPAGRAFMAAAERVAPMVQKPWFQTDGAIENPFYGSEMLSCGSFKK